jgi:hypothetical protein
MGTVLNMYVLQFIVAINIGAKARTRRIILLFILIYYSYFILIDVSDLF